MRTTGPKLIDHQRSNLPIKLLKFPRAGIASVDVSDYKREERNASLHDMITVRRGNNNNNLSRDTCHSKILKCKVFCYLSIIIIIIKEKEKERRTIVVPQITRLDLIIWIFYENFVNARSSLSSEVLFSRSHPPKNSSLLFCNQLLRVTFRSLPLSLSLSLARLLKVSSTATV